MKDYHKTVASLLKKSTVRNSIKPSHAKRNPIKKSVSPEFIFVQVKPPKYGVWLTYKVFAHTEANHKKAVDLALTLEKRNPGVAIRVILDKLRK